MPRSVSGQIALIILTSVVLVVVMGRIGGIIRHSETLGLYDFEHFIERAATITPLMRAVPESRREDLASLVAASGLDLEVVGATEVAEIVAGAIPRNWIDRSMDLLFPADDEVPTGSRLLSYGDETLLLVPLDDTTTLVAHGPPKPFLSNDVLGPLSYYVLAFATLLVVFGGYSRWAFLAPIARISEAVNRSNGTEEDRFVTGEGPQEVVALTDALNQMRSRVRDLLDTRARMLRAVSHDLRTPLTRLRQRTERVEDSHLQNTMLSDIDQIDRLIEETLDYLRADAGGEEAERIDVASLLQTIQADFADFGSNVHYDGPDHLVATLKPNAMLRAITNLCGNGLKFGDRVVIMLSREEAVVRIDVVDDGPGIPADLRDRVLEPFFKASPTRSDVGGKSGFGLGLSIVADIVASHRGRLTLLDNRPSGLIARVELPQ